MSFQFTKATKEQAKARVALVGPAGSGKTWTALQIATGIGGRIAVVDTENRTARKYSDQFEFFDADMVEPFTPERYIEAIHAAEQAGFDVLILDSITHEWSGKGGCLDQVEAEKRRSKSNNSFNAWGKVTPRHNAFIDAMLRSKIHLIATMRSKVEYVVETTSKGKSVPRKVGMAPIQREGMDYEFDLVLEMDGDHNAIVTKTRVFDLAGKVFAKPGQELGQHLRGWLTDGEEARPRPDSDGFGPSDVPSVPPQRQQRQQQPAPNPPPPGLVAAQEEAFVGASGKLAEIGVEGPKQALWSEVLVVLKREDVNPKWFTPEHVQLALDSIMADLEEAEGENVQELAIADESTDEEVAA